MDLTETDAAGMLGKREVADLLAIADPHDLDGDGSARFRFPFWTIEAILPVDAHTLPIANDNNYPLSMGRPPDIDRSELILVRLDRPLDGPAPPQAGSQVPDPSGSRVEGE